MSQLPHHEIRSRLLIPDEGARRGARGVLINRPAVNA
jgi:hypothetical protein